MTSVHNGFSITEKVFDIVEIDNTPWVGIKKLELKPFDTFYFYEDEFGNLVRFTQKIGTVELDLDMDNFIHFVNNPSVDKNYGQSELREAYRSYFSKDIVIKFWNIFLQRYASGFVWAQVQEGFNLDPQSEQYKALQKVLENIQVSTGIIVPNGVELNVEQPTTTDAYECAIDKHDRGIAKALLVPNLLGITEQGKTGSYSQSQTQLEAFFWTLESDASRLREVLNEQLFRHLGDLNFGDGIYPKFKFKPISLQMALDIFKRWNDLVTGKAVTATDEDEAHIRDILGFPPAGEPINVGGQEEPSEDDGQSEEDPNSMDDVETDDETIIGNKGTQRVAALSKASSRVDFIAIDNKADVITLKQTSELEDAMNVLVISILEKIPDGVEIDPKLASKMAPTSKSIDGVKKVIFNTLQDGWKVGEQQSAIEIKRAERQAKKEFSKKIDMDRLGDKAKKFFDAKSFIIAGDLSQQATNIAKQEIMTGIQYSYSTKEIRDNIVKRLASAGLLSEETLDAFGDITEVGNIEHRLDTVIRTSSFMAINEGRYNYYTDPSLGGFVKAFEYSSILDTRTTEICNELGGASGGTPHTHSVNWPGWDRFRPPNHYNCRSILIPITEIDDWEESGEPTVSPQDGFG
jgi:hypothetical protein